MEITVQGKATKLSITTNATWTPTTTNYEQSTIFDPAKSTLPCQE